MPIYLFIYFIIMLFVIHVLITLTKSGAVCYGCVSDGNAIICIAFFIYHRILKKKNFLSFICCAMDIFLFNCLQFPFLIRSLSYTKFNLTLWRCAPEIQINFS